MIAHTHHYTNGGIDMFIVAPSDLIQTYTRLYEGERFADGRPRVSDDIIERMKLVTTEEAWGVLRRNG